MIEGAWVEFWGEELKVIPISGDIPRENRITVVFSTDPVQTDGKAIYNKLNHQVICRVWWMPYEWPMNLVKSHVAFSNTKPNGTMYPHVYFCKDGEVELVANEKIR